LVFKQFNFYLFYFILSWQFTLQNKSLSRILWFCGSTRFMDVSCHFQHYFSFMKLSVEETGDNKTFASNRQALSHGVVSSATRYRWESNSQTLFLLGMEATAICKTAICINWCKTQVGEALRNRLVYLIIYTQIVFNHFANF